MLQQLLASGPAAATNPPDLAAATADKAAQAADARLHYAFALVLGHIAVVTTAAGDVFEGVVHAVVRAERMLVLKAVRHLEKAASIDAGDKKKKKNGTDADTPGLMDTLVVPLKDVAMFTVLHVATVNDDAKRASKAGFKTDTAISGATDVKERALERWVPEDDGSGAGGADMDLLHLDASTRGARGWNQFEVNETKFGLTTDYQEDIYTTTLDRSSDLYKQHEREAARIAREIEAAGSANVHVLEERGHAANDVDEEDRYGAVVRETAAAAAAAVPSHTRNAKEAYTSGRPRPKSFVGSAERPVLGAGGGGNAADQSTDSAGSPVPTAAKIGRGGDRPASLQPSDSASKLLTGSAVPASATSTLFRSPLSQRSPAPGAAAAAATAAGLPQISRDTVLREITRYKAVLANRTDEPAAASADKAAMSAAKEFARQVAQMPILVPTMRTLQYAHHNPAAAAAAAAAAASSSTSSSTASSSSSAAVPHHQLLQFQARLAMHNKVKAEQAAAASAAAAARQDKTAQNAASLQRRMGAYLAKEKQKIWESRQKLRAKTFDELRKFHAAFKLPKPEPPEDIADLLDKERARKRIQEHEVKLAAARKARGAAASAQGAKRAGSPGKSATGKDETKDKKSALNVTAKPFSFNLSAKSFVPIHPASSATGTTPSPTPAVPDTRKVQTGFFAGKELKVDPMSVKAMFIAPSVLANMNDTTWPVDQPNRSFRNIAQGIEMPVFPAMQPMYFIPTTPQGYPAQLPPGAQFIPMPIPMHYPGAPPGAMMPAPFGMPMPGMPVPPPPGHYNPAAAPNAPPPVPGPNNPQQAGRRGSPPVSSSAQPQPGAPAPGTAAPAYFPGAPMFPGPMFPGAPIPQGPHPPMGAQGATAQPPPPHSAGVPPHAAPTGIPPHHMAMYPMAAGPGMPIVPILAAAPGMPVPAGVMVAASAPLPQGAPAHGISPTHQGPPASAQALAE
ncbi:hypothetical protein AMAG_00642 [Allomyces macrogynus ATCC 38327]|uniref:LsmAD domain-containing protein n=1 Tax=Allomyces macrogynus (strain ATCC 38327) TaxID=578462 RepID=A0A0L0RWF9_ALLM3|nr:hypothetical protein AMAG_00642 [Allomyces macrogynus ATCC 38327]|eukprot:KNE54683.1 hypothetical protein AMAG_00642 [Allomyces macrogynus ATCC 38327]